MEDEIQKKKTGKRKIEIKPILNKPSKQVTFSKRKTGLFKKASELCSLCGAEMAVITFSSAGKLFSFGHPNADDIISRYLHFSDCKNIQTPNNNNPINYCSNTNISKISEHYKDVLTSINLEKKRVVTNKVGGGTSSSNNNCNKFDYWWDVPIDESMGLNELQQLKIALEGLRVEVASRIDGINDNNRSSMMSEFSGNNADEFGSSDGNNNGGNYEDSAGWNNNGDQGLVIPSFSPLMMMNSLFENNASQNLAIFQ